MLDIYLNIIGNIMTILASGLAIFIFFKNKDKIVSAINFILNYSYQITLNDLKVKIDKLNDYTVDNDTSKSELINLFHDIEGQILGNKVLQEKLEPQLKKIVRFTTNPKHQTNPNKRSLVAELRECVRNLDVSNLGDFINLKSNKQ